MQQHHLALEQAIRQLAQAVGNHPPERAEIARFFQELIDGGWDAYEEATAHESEELRKGGSGDPSAAGADPTTAGQ